jgi:deoxyribodipyrimidine photo-lyase
MMKKIIVWFRKDLRLHDQPALWEAAREGTIIPVFIWAKEEEREYRSSEAALWWLHHSLRSLQQSLSSHGLSLVIRSGPSLDTLINIIEETTADAVFFNHRYEPSIMKRERDIINALQTLGVEVRTFHSHLLFSPDRLLNQKGEPYKVFTPFWKRCIQEAVPRPLPVPKTMHGDQGTTATMTVEQLELLSPLRWHAKFQSYWEPGETGAIARWNTFVKNGLSRYEEGRDFPFQEAVSRLSPHLAWGDISARALWHAAKRRLVQEVEHGEGTIASKPIEAFLRQLIWREFGYHQLIHFPTIVDAPIREPFQSFPWQEDVEHWERWKKGLTGYPLIDAGMRELWETGWMHNRVRMVVASFLVKHLLIDWRKGAKWFQQTLVDFDVANNAMGWQWSTGCGLDAAPYFRIFNPVAQSEKFDENGDYIRRWVPELANLPAPYIHRPWEAPEHVLRAAGVELGRTYPLPIIDHRFARERALQAYEMMKKG